MVGLVELEIIDDQTGCLRGLLGFRSPFMLTKEVHVKFAESRANAIRRRLRDDEHGQDGKYRGDDQRAGRRDEGCEWSTDDPAHNPTGISERGKTVRGIGKTIHYVGDARRGRNEECETDSDSTVIAHGTRVQEEPRGQQNEDHREPESNDADETGKRPLAQDAGNVVARQKPLNDGSRNRHQNEKKGHAIATVFWGKFLRAERTKRTAGDVRHTHPHASEPGVFDGFRRLRAHASRGGPSGILGARRRARRGRPGCGSARRFTGSCHALHRTRAHPHSPGLTGEC